MFKTKGRARFFGILTGLLITALFIAIDFISCTSCAGGEQGDGRVSETRLLLGTYCTITIIEEAGATGNTSGSVLLGEAFRLCERMEARLSTAAEGSDVWNVNHAQGQMTAVGSQTIDIVRRGIEFGELSDGMFDITIGALSSLWDFNTARIPSEAELKQAQKTVKYGQVTIDENSLQLRDIGAQLDLGGIAKGYIADEIAGFLVQRGVKNALIDLGGDIVVIGARPGGTSWRLGVQEPFGEAEETIGVLEVSDVAVVSSGIYERCFRIDDVLYHHILDPKTGMPAKSDVIGATIIADDAVTGEGLSTIAVLVGSERAAEIFAQTDGYIGAVLVLEDGELLVLGEAELVR